MTKHFAIIRSDYISYEGGDAHVISNGKIRIPVWENKDDTLNICTELNEIIDENEQLWKDVQEQERRKFACIETAHSLKMENEELKQENSQLKSELHKQSKKCTESIKKAQMELDLIKLTNKKAIDLIEQAIVEGLDSEKAETLLEKAIKELEE